MLRLNGINNAEFYVGKAEEVLPDYYKEYAKTQNGETAHADVIVVDPPRKGCDEIAALRRWSKCSRRGLCMSAATARHWRGI